MKTLFIVGAQRSGTSYLYKILDSHPSVELAKPIKPEPKFFLNKKLFALGKEYYLSRYFDTNNNKNVYFGEKSTSYIERPEAAKRIYNFFPDAKILFILREPTARAWSNYIFSKNSGLETKTFFEAINIDPEKREYDKNISVNPFNYINRGQYFGFIQTYTNLFKPENIRIEIFEDFVGNLKSIKRLYDWLGLESNFEPENYFLPVNQSKSEALPNDVCIELSKKFEHSNLLIEEYLGRAITSWKTKG